MQSYLVFYVVVLWPSHGLVSQYFTDPETESVQFGVYITDLIQIQCFSRKSAL